MGGEVRAQLEVEKGRADVQRAVYRVTAASVLSVLIDSSVATVIMASCCLLEANHWLHIEETQTRSHKILKVLLGCVLRYQNQRSILVHLENSWLDLSGSPLHRIRYFLFIPLLGTPNQSRSLEFLNLVFPFLFHLASVHVSSV